MFDVMTRESLTATVERFRSTDRNGWAGPAMVDDLRDAVAAWRAVETEVHLLVAQVEAAGLTTTKGGAAGTAAWLERETGIPRTKAQQVTRTAKFLNRHPTTGDALADDEVTLDHVRAIASVVCTRRDQLYDDHEQVLLDAARTVPINDFTKLARRWASLADDALANDDAKRIRQGRRWHYAVGTGGTVTTDGFFDPAAGAKIIKAIDFLSPPDAADTPGGPRTPAQRRADALEHLADYYLTTAGHGDIDELGPSRSRGTAASVSVIVDYATLMGNDVPMERARCDLEFVGPVPRSTVQRITCDSALHRIVMQGQRQVLDVGRQRRLVAPAQRRALVARDGGCIGCGRPASWCEAHHVVSWTKGGTTDLDNLVLVCPRCHTLLHEGGSSVTRTHDGRYEIVPDGWHPP